MWACYQHLHAWGLRENGTALEYGSKPNGIPSVPSLQGQSPAVLVEYLVLCTAQNEGGQYPPRDLGDERPNCQQPIRKTTMTLSEYFSTEPRGAKLEMAEHLGITPTWLSLLMSGRKRASPLLCVKIEEATQQLVTRKELRPDLFS